MSRTLIRKALAWRRARHERPLYWRQTAPRKRWTGMTEVEVKHAMCLTVPAGGLILNGIDAKTRMGYQDWREKNWKVGQRYRMTITLLQPKPKRNRDDSAPKPPTGARP